MTFVAQVKITFKSTHHQPEESPITMQGSASSSIVDVAWLLIRPVSSTDVNLAMLKRKTSPFALHAQKHMDRWRQ